MRRDLDAALARIDTIERHLFKTDAMRAHYGLPPHPEADEF